METRDIWAQMASRYDTENRVKATNIIVGAVRQALTDTKGKTAVDFGCGTGLVGLGLMDRFASMLFVDASQEMIEQVEGKIERGQIKHATVLCADFLADPPGAPVADCIITAQVLLHIPDTRLILKRLYDALTEGGRLIVVDFDKNDAVPSDRVHNGFDQNELIDMAKQAGFVEADAHTFYHGEKLFMGQDASMFLMSAQK